MFGLEVGYLAWWLVVVVGGGPGGVFFISYYITGCIPKLSLVSCLEVLKKFLWVVGGLVGG